MGSFTDPDHYTEFRHHVARAMERAAEVLVEVEDDYHRILGRHHGGPLPTYRVDDADAVLITMGTATTTARTTVDALRARGKKVGLAKLRAFRPFPVRELRQLAKSVDRVGVVDRSFTFGASGAAFMEVAGALYGSSRRPFLRNFVAGLGGRDLTPAVFERLFAGLLKGEGPEVDWADLRGRVEVVRHG